MSNKDIINEQDKIYYSLFEKQTQYYHEGKTKRISDRIKLLKKLRLVIRDNEDLINNALKSDLNKSKFETYATETGFVLEEIRYHIEHLKRWAKPTKYPTPLTNFPASSYTVNEPLGTVFIIAPWNYPFQLLLAPLIGAISAGNTAILKPSEISEATSGVIEKIINESFDSGVIHVVQGDARVTQSLLKLKFNHIFFTGSPGVGKIVMQEAAKNLIPVTLELGGKSPCIVHNDINIWLTAKRIIWGKLLNAGQTCIAPDYILVHKNVKEKLIDSLINAIKNCYGPNASVSEDYPRIINQSNVLRLAKLTEGTNIRYGGKYNTETRYFEPTIIDSLSMEEPLMQQEIFGPVIPVITYEELSEVINLVNSRPKPLALYFFSGSRKNQNMIVDSISAGGVTINDTIMHIVSNQLPFGGVGNSGMGKYHGEYSYEIFSNKKPVVYKKTWMDIPIRYAPFKNKLKLLKLLIR